MHQESLNAKSFARRASPRRDRFLSSFDGVKLCDTCRSNQALVMSLLSSYLPPSEDDPEYRYRLDTYDEYKRTLEARYPPLCGPCSVLVEEEIRRKNSMARLNVLGRGLANTKRTDKKRQVSASMDDRMQLKRELLWWRLRGVLFWLTLAIAVAVDWIGATSTLAHDHHSCKRLYLAMLALSPLWMAWDPTYAHMRRARLQGRRVNVHGRRTYIMLQSFMWFNRLVLSLLLVLPELKPSWDLLKLQHVPPSQRSRSVFLAELCIEMLVCVASYIALRLYDAPHVRLLYETAERDRSRTATPAPPSAPPGKTRFTTPVFSAPSKEGPSSAHVSRTSRSASLEPQTSFNKASSSTHSVFGRPSLLANNWSASGSRDPRSRTIERRAPTKVDEDEDAMDWTPTVPEPEARPRQPQVSRSTPSGVRREDTGLEDLFAGTKLVEEPPRFGAFRTMPQAGGWSWWWVYGLLIIPLSAIVYALWLSRRVPYGPMNA
ncbi:unnamed protein product [Peniophora sp. CBMAI 1063]|nr:unnamed protein product [Peniophora sp. CBMAI 1063]